MPLWYPVRREGWSAWVPGTMYHGYWYRYPQVPELTTVIRLGCQLTSINNALLDPCDNWPNRDILRRKLKAQSLRLHMVKVFRSRVSTVALRHLIDTAVTLLGYFSNVLQVDEAPGPAAKALEIFRV